MAIGQLVIQSVAPESPYLDSVKQLWRANSKTLGFFPDGAFVERAERNQILVAIDAKCCVGYLIYRTSRQKVFIDHLCVNRDMRTQGIGSVLVRELCKQTRDRYQGIGLSCRRDYAEHDFWPKVGFVAQREKVGKSADGHWLTFYWLDFQHSNLFTQESNSDDQALEVVLDANVFFDLQDNTRNGAEESQGLLADWLLPHLRLAVDEELFNEINRHPDAETRRERKRFSYQFSVIACGDTAFFVAQERLKELFPRWKSNRDAADMRHLARTIPSSANVFVTRDEEVLKAADAIYEVFGLSVLSPSELIGRLDELTREAAYQRSQLAGTNLKIRQVHGDAEQFASTFQSQQLGERQVSLKQELRRCMAQPRRYSCQIVIREPNDHLALIVADNQAGSSVRIRVLRCSGDRLAGSLARTLLRSVILEAVRDDRPAVILEEQFVTEMLVSALRDMGFIQCGQSWLKVCLASVATATETAKLVEDRLARISVVDSESQRLIDVLSSNEVRNNALVGSDAEHAIWPAKLIDCEIPTYVVAIEPKWALHLFDERLARQTLFGADVELALNPESVYYRAHHATSPTAPARVLWYVTKNQKYPGSMQLRACSRIEEVVHGKPKDLFRRFRRLGVYEWQHVFELSKFDLDREIEAFRFSDTEVFEKPIGFERLQVVLRSFGVRSTFQSPTRVPNEAFTVLYREGRSLAPDR